MKLWKPIVVGLVVGLTLGLAWATMEGDFPPNAKANAVKQGRMQLVDKIYPYGNGYTVIILKVDGREYLINEHGGIVPLDRKP